MHFRSFLSSLMKLHVITIILRILALAALGVLGVFIFGVDPELLTISGQALFFSSVFIFVMSVVALFLFSLAHRFLGERGREEYRSAALRQGVLLSLFATGILFLQYLGYTTWWGTLLLFAFILLIEFTSRQFTHR